ncbi:carboxylesterase/lipase family protein [Amycolatopsis pithecellobii]|uniref:Carboxylic ester hydrolase n=1 Tax=Amycolatopsis pithecellobii TaxID=664692 RepID=A0A6N7Z772_9PSEU|nr:carboxylesterase family protein [Amycolatopsis pithecellobii]MTD57979.1 carboxylesterase family protein [Amycolatopsis pithecellobii]
MNVEVQTRQGIVRGARGDRVVSFKGIPFAAAPIGDLRFAPPAEPPSWHGVRDATRYGAISLQHLDGLAATIPGCEWAFYHPGAVQDEDCLNLNIWVPDMASDTPRAIFVWIHGGSFLAGSGTALWYDGANLAAREDIIVVTVNYRLGALGALSVDPEGTAGNNFLRDQIAALTWIRDNIGVFGGDPAKVTIGGESAGAMSVVALMCIPEARGLFRAGIVQSGHGSLNTTKEQALDVAVQYIADLGAPETNSLTALRALDTQTLLDAQERLTGKVMLPCRPVVDGEFLPATPLEIFRAGKQAQIPLLTGTNADENSLFTLVMGDVDARGGLPGVLSELFEGADPVVIEELARMYGALATNDADALTTLTTDRDWRGPLDALCDAHADSGSPVFVYEFTYRTPVLDGALGACHALDIPFPFGNLATRGVSEFAGDDKELRPVREATQDAFMRSWGSFIRTGEPSGPDLPSWPAYRSDQRTMMRIGTDGGLVVDPYRERLDRLSELMSTAEVFKF